MPEITLAGSSASDKGKQRAVSPSPPLTATATARDIFANPRYASQMTAAFTEQNAIHQAIEEKRRAVDAERLANIEKAKNHVIIYAWPKDDVEPTVFEVQGGFKSPLFPLTPSVLCDADLMLPGQEHARFKKYNPSIHTWSKVPVGHVMDIVQRFEKCDEARRGRRSVPKAFVKCFDIPFRRTTFYNRRLWGKAPAAIRDQALRAGRTPAGLWATFLDPSGL